MGKASRAKHRAAARAPQPRSRSQQWWYVATAMVVVLGVFMVVLTKTQNGGGGGAATDRPRVDFDHWHAAIGVNVCGEWLADAPAFEVRKGTQVAAGINTHGDGLIHIRPKRSDEAGSRATLGRFMEFGGWKVSSDSFRVWGDVSKRSGDKCKGSKATVRWSVDGKVQHGDPSKHKLADLEVIAIALLPPGDDIGQPPSAKGILTPDDMTEVSQTTLPGASTTKAPPTETTAPGTTSAPGESTTAPAITTAQTVTTTSPATTAPSSSTTAPGSTTSGTVPPPPTAPSVP